LARHRERFAPLQAIRSLGSLDAKLIAVRVTVDRIEMHIRGVTAEPWGHGRTLLVRSHEGVWRLLPD
jgi:hypothetical protein